MSLQHNALIEAADFNGDFNKAVKVWDWVRTKIDFVKFRLRVSNATRYDTKVVLMEYSSTWRKDGETTHFYVPGSSIKTSCLDYDKRVLDYLHYQIGDRDPSVQVYTRRKIVDGVVPHPYIRQLVVLFTAKPIADVMSPIETLDEQ